MDSFSTEILNLRSPFRIGVKSFPFFKHGFDAFIMHPSLSLLLGQPLTCSPSVRTHYADANLLLELVQHSPLRGVISSTEASGFIPKAEWDQSLRKHQSTWSSHDCKASLENIFFWVCLLDYAWFQISRRKLALTAVVTAEESTEVCTFWQNLSIWTIVIGQPLPP